MADVFIIAGEASGDAHAAELVTEVGRVADDITFRGIGGQAMSAAGVELFMDITEHAAVGVVEALMSARQLLAAYRLIKRRLKEDRPDAIVLIDFPDFNLRIAKHAHRLGIKVIYYISPQIWAWRTGRVRAIRRYVDHMLVIFPFEADFYAQHDIPAEFVGHPLVDRLADAAGRDECREKLGLNPDRTVVGLLPGSRRKEIEVLLPRMLEASRRLLEQWPELDLIIGAAPGRAELIRRIAGPADLRIVDGDTWAAMAASDMLLIASGTATVEAMCLNVPMVVTYRVSLGTYLAFAWLMKLDRFAMPNIIAGKDIVPELMQWDATADNMFKEASGMLSTGRLEYVGGELSEAAEKLGGRGASARAARSVVAALTAAGHVHRSAGNTHSPKPHRGC